MASMFSKRVHLTAVLAILAVLVFAEWAPAQTGTPGAWCVLRRHNTYKPPNCFEFFLCDTTKDTQRCGPPGGGPCGVGQLGLREGWQVDPNAHPLEQPGTLRDLAGGRLRHVGAGPFPWRLVWVSRPEEDGTPPAHRGARRRLGAGFLRPAKAHSPVAAQLLRIPPDSRRERSRGDPGRNLYVTAHAAQENWTVDPNFGGPHLVRDQAQAAHDHLHRFAGNFYNCPTWRHASSTPAERRRRRRTSA